MENSKIYNPSLKLERKTKALNKELWGFVALISMFTVLIGVICIGHLMMCSILDIVSTFISDSSIILTLVVLIFTMIFGIGLFKFLKALLNSYKIENQKITKGTIISFDKLKQKDAALNIEIESYVSKNMRKPKIDYKVKNLNDIQKLINLNLDSNFVQKYFDTEIYRKKEYYNVKLLKETKYSLIYISENKKKIVIPKIYEGMKIKEDNKKEASMVSRVIKKSVFIFLICLTVSCIDLAVGYNKNLDIKVAISNQYLKIKENLNIYGYESKEINKKVYEFSKKVSDKRTSTIKYYFDNNGNIKKVDIDLYYKEYFKKEELRGILGTLNIQFDSTVEQFIQKVNEGVNNKYEYSKLELENYVIKIDLSDGHVRVHN